MKILVAYDGTLDSKTTLKYAIHKIREKGGKMTVLHVFKSTMFIDYEGGPGAPGIARTEATRHLEEAKRIIAEQGMEMQSSLIMEEGDPEEELIRHATRDGFDVIFVPPHFRSVLKKSPCPVSVIPGNILMPMDNTESGLLMLDTVTREAELSKSNVLLLGIVPVHIYTQSERDELEELRKATSSAVKKIKTKLESRKIAVKEVMTSGYPDEEILKVAESNPITMIIMPVGGSTPSELCKAASIITEQPERLRNPLLLVSAQKRN